MVRKTVVHLVDDLDGSEGADVETVYFSFRGDCYEIDLVASNARRLHDALAPFIASARRAGGQPPAPTGTAPGVDREQMRAMRSWGRGHGFTVNERGRVSKELYEAYHAEQ